MASCENKYTTLLDLSRQAKVITGETACFDGKIEVGIPFSGYPTGVDNGSAVSLGVVSSETAVFSGNTGTTVFDVSNTGSTNYNALFSGYSGTVWTNALFSGNTSGLTLPITTLSADTQIVGEDIVIPTTFPPFTALTTVPIWTLTQTATTSNGEHIIGIQYTGYTITYAFSQLEQLSVTAYTAYSGFSSASQENFSAGTLDYKGPLDYISTKEDATVDGILTTKKLTVTDGASSATTGYVLTQTGNTGEVGWVFNSASGGTTGGYWLSGSSGTNSIRVANGGTTDATGNYALAQNLNTLASGVFSHSEGLGTIASGSSSHSEGRDTIAGGQNSHAQGVMTIASGNESHAGGESSEAEGATSFVHSSSSKVTGDRSAILGGQGITGTTDDTVYVPNLNIGTVGGGASVNNLGIDTNGNVVTGTTGGAGGVTIDPYECAGSYGAVDITWDVSGTSTNYDVLLTGNTTLNLINVRNGEYGTIIARQDGVGSHTISFGTINGGGANHYVVNGGGGSPTLTTTSGTTDILSFTYGLSCPDGDKRMYWTVGNDYT